MVFRVTSGSLATARLVIMIQAAVYQVCGGDQTCYQVFIRKSNEEYQAERCEIYGKC